ncbi:MAG: TIGR00730 family Rossman fold protein [Thermomonas sp.]
MKTICVYCGSNTGRDPAYAAQAGVLGQRLATDGIALVYGGGNVGLMGIIADAVLAGGGEVIGVIPQQLVDWEVAHRGVTRLEVVDSMHTRKARMFELADGFVALPGGFGTLDEMFEMLTWRQLGLGKKPCAFFDVGGFWQPLMTMLDTMVSERFLHADQRQDLWHGDDIETLLAWMQAYVPAQADKWLDEKRSGQLKLTPDDV